MRSHGSSDTTSSTRRAIRRSPHCRSEKGRGGRPAVALAGLSRGSTRRIWGGRRVLLGRCTGLVGYCGWIGVFSNLAGKGLEDGTESGLHLEAFTVGMPSRQKAGEQVVLVRSCLPRVFRVAPQDDFLKTLGSEIARFVRTNGYAYWGA